MPAEVTRYGRFAVTAHVVRTMFSEDKSEDEIDTLIWGNWFAQELELPAASTIAFVTAIKAKGLDPLKLEELLIESTGVDVIPESSDQ